MTKLLMVGSLAVSFLLAGPVFSDGGYTTAGSSSANSILQAISGGLSTCQPKGKINVGNLSQLQSLSACSASGSYSRVKSFFDQAVSKAGGGGAGVAGGGAAPGSVPVPSFGSGSTP